MVAHTGLFGETCNVVHGNFRVLGVDDVITHGGVHVEDDGDAPAVLRPGRKICIIHGRRSPKESSVPRLSTEGEILLLITLSHDLDDLAVDLVEVLLLAVYRLPGIETVQRLRNARER